MATLKDLETTLKNIRLAVRGAFDRISGKIDPNILDAQEAVLKRWIFDFQTAYLAKAVQKSSDRSSILLNGKKILNQAVFCRDVLISTELEARSPPFPPAREILPSGNVDVDLQAQVDVELTKLLNTFIDYRRESLKE